MKKYLIVFFVMLTFAVGCSGTISEEKYIDTMVAIGCKGVVSETGPKVDEIFKEKGVTKSDIEKFRKKMNPKQSMKIAMEIAQKVTACHGIKIMK